MIINGMDLSQVDFNFSAQVEMVNEEANLAFCSALADMVELAVARALANDRVERLGKDLEEAKKNEQFILAKVQDGMTQIHKLSIIITDMDRMGVDSSKLVESYSNFEKQIKMLRGILNEVVQKRKTLNQKLEMAERVVYFHSMGGGDYDRYISRENIYPLISAM